MRGCEEARYYRRNCGLRRLDGDSEGVPSDKSEYNFFWFKPVTFPICRHG